MGAWCGGSWVESTCRWLDRAGMLQAASWCSSPGESTVSVTTYQWEQSPPILLARFCFQASLFALLVPLDTHAL